MELVVTNALPFSSASSTAGLDNSRCNSSSFLVVKPRLKNAGWSTLAEIVLVLRSILKCLNQDFEDDDNLAEVFLDSVYHCLSNMPWDSLDVIYNSQNNFSVDALGPRTLDEGSRVVFLGNLIQLFCSMVEQCGSVGDAGCSQDKHPFLCLVTNLVPKLFYWCLGMQGQHVIICIPQYFRHKLLVSIFFSWLLDELRKQSPGIHYLHIILRKPCGIVITHWCKEFLGMQVMLHFLIEIFPYILF